MDGKIGDAEAVYNNEKATQEEVNAQITSLNNTMSRLVTIVDRDLSNAKVSADAKINHQDYKADYTEDTRKALEATLEMPETNDEEKIAKTAAINDAITNLKTVLPQLNGGLKFTDVKGETNNGKTMINLGEVSAAGNTFVYKISDDDNPVERPSLGTNLSTWTPITNGTIMEVANGKHIGVAEINAKGIVVQFSDAQAETLDYQWASSANLVAFLIPDLSTDLTGKTLKFFINVDGEGPDNTFCLDLSNIPANKYKNVGELVEAIKGATNEKGEKLSDVANVAAGDRISIGTKSATNNSSIRVSYEGAWSDGVSLTGYHGGLNAHGYGEKN